MRSGQNGRTSGARNDGIHDEYQRGFARHCPSGLRTTVVSAMESGVARRPIAVLAVIVPLLLLTLVLNIASGEYPLSVSDALSAIAGRGSAIDRHVVNNIRLPVGLTGIMAGMLLAMSGAIFHGRTADFPIRIGDIIETYE